MKWRHTQRPSMKVGTLPVINFVNSGYVIFQYGTKFVNLTTDLQKVDMENNILDQIEMYKSQCRQLLVWLARFTSRQWAGIFRTLRPCARSFQRSMLSPNTIISMFSTLSFGQSSSSLLLMFHLICLVQHDRVKSRITWETLVKNHNFDGNGDTSGWSLSSCV